MPIVYLLRSFSQWREGDASTVDRMMLRPRVSTKDTISAQNGEAFKVPHRVVYRHTIAGGENPWRYSCLSEQVDTITQGTIIGDGSDAAALAWLLEGER